MADCLLFHLNLRIFGGSTVKKNDALVDYLKQVVANDGPYLCFAFTEITNKGKALEAIQGALQLAGLEGYKSFAIATGYSPYASKNAAAKAIMAPEFAIIATHPDYVIDYVGTVFVTGTSPTEFTSHLYLVSDQAMSWQYIPSDPSGPQWEGGDNTGTMTPKVPAVYRGIATVVGRTLNGDNIIVGIVHNTYQSGETTILTTGLPIAHNSIYSVILNGNTTENYVATSEVDGNTIKYVNAQFIYGGDWNNDPREIPASGQYFTLNDSEYMFPTFAPYNTTPAVPANYVPLTIGGNNINGARTTVAQKKPNVYDYWLNPVDKQACTISFVDYAPTTTVYTTKLVATAPPQGQTLPSFLQPGANGYTLVRKYISDHCSVFYPLNFPSPPPENNGGGNTEIVEEGGGGG